MCCGRQGRKREELGELEWPRHEITRATGMKDGMWGKKSKGSEAERGRDREREREGEREREARVIGELTG